MLSHDYWREASIRSLQNPYGTPRPTDSQSPKTPQQQKEIPKTLKSSRITKSKRYRCDPDCLVQPPNSWIAPKSIGEGASGLFGGWPESPQNVSFSRATPRLHRCKSGVAHEQETFSGLPGHPQKRPLASSPIDLGGNPAIRRLYQAIGVATLLKVHAGSWLCCAVFMFGLRLQSPHTGVSTPLRPEIPKKSQKGVSGPPCPECQKSVEKVSED